MPDKYISPQKEPEILALYATGLTTHKVAAKIGCSQTYVMNTLKRHSITRRSIYSYTRKIDIDEHYFDIINTEEKAYFLGIMFADGNNYRSEKYRRHDYQIAISLQEEDKEILERLAALISDNLELKFRAGQRKEWKNQYRLRFDSKVVSAQLTKLGCVPDKSLVLTYPTILPELHNHFLRGYFDGDGSITSDIQQRKTTTYTNWKWSLVSTTDFCIEAKKIIKSSTKLDLYYRLCHPERNDITTSLSLGGNQQVYRLLTWLYKDSTIFLKRKHDKFLELEQQINDRLAKKLDQNKMRRPTKTSAFK